MTIFFIKIDRHVDNKNKQKMIKLNSIFTTLFFITFCQFSFAQMDTTKMLLNWKRPNYLGLYVVPEMQVGKVAGDFTMLNGGSLMAIIDKKLSVGVIGLGLRNRSYQPADVTPLYLRGGYGGLKLEYTLRPNGAVHFSFPLVIGAGYARTDSTSTRIGGRDHNCIDRDNNISNANRNNGRFVIAPGVNLEANIFRFGKLFVGAQYLWMQSGTDAVTGKNANYLDGVSFKVGAKFGFFDYYIGKKNTESIPMQ